MSGDEVSRRALLGAAVGFPLLPRHPELVSGSSPPPPGRTTSWTLKQVQGDGEWEKALAAFEAAQAEVLRIEAATAGYALEDEETLLPAHDAACEAMDAARGRLLLVPVPNLAGFAAKLELFFEHELEPFSVEEDVAAVIRSDVRRLAATRGGESSGDVPNRSLRWPSPT